MGHTNSKPQSSAGVTLSTAQSCAQRPFQEAAVEVARLHYTAISFSLKPPEPVCDQDDQHGSLFSSIQTHSGAFCGTESLKPCQETPKEPSCVSFLLQQNVRGSLLNLHHLP